MRILENGRIQVGHNLITIVTGALANGNAVTNEEDLKVYVQQGGSVRVLDGQHRLEAFRRFFQNSKHDQKHQVVPCSVYRRTLPTFDQTVVAVCGNNLAEVKNRVVDMYMSLAKIKAHMKAGTTFSADFVKKLYGNGTGQKVFTVFTRLNNVVMDELTKELETPQYQLALRAAGFNEILDQAKFPWPWDLHTHILWTPGKLQACILAAGKAATMGTTQWNPSDHERLLIQRQFFKVSLKVSPYEPNEASTQCSGMSL